MKCWEYANLIIQKLKEQNKNETELMKAINVEVGLWSTIVSAFIKMDVWCPEAFQEFIASHPILKDIQTSKILEKQVDV